MFDEHEVPRIIDALLVASYKRLPHWFFVHGRNHITLQYSRRGMSIVAPPDVWDAYTDLFALGDGEVIAGRLDRLGWRRRPSYGFTRPGAAVYMMSSAIEGSEMWLDIRGPTPHLVRAALDPLGVARLADDAPPHAPATQRTVPNVTAHPLVGAEVYLPSAYTGVIVAARDTSADTTLCHVQHADGMIEQSLAYRSRSGDGRRRRVLVHSRRPRRVALVVRHVNADGCIPCRTAHGDRMEERHTYTTHYGANDLASDGGR